MSEKGHLLKNLRKTFQRWNMTFGEKAYLKKNQYPVCLRILIFKFLIRIIKREKKKNKLERKS